MKLRARYIDVKYNWGLQCQDPLRKHRQIKTIMGQALGEPMLLIRKTDLRDFSWQIYLLLEFLLRVTEGNISFIFRFVRDA